MAVLASIFARGGSYQSPQAFVDGMVPAVLLGSVVVGIGAVLAFLIPRSVSAQQQAPQVAENAAAIRLGDGPEVARVMVAIDD